MIRKEEIIKASVAYNERNGKLNVFGGSNILSDEEYFAFNKNPDFIAGAEWADKKLIDKVCEWLLNNIRYYSTNALGAEYMCEDLRKAMSDETE